MFIHTSDNLLCNFSRNFVQVMCDLLGIRKIAMNPYHPNGNDGAERVNPAMAHMLAKVVKGRQDGWNVQLPHFNLVYNN